MANNNVKGAGLPEQDVLSTETKASASSDQQDKMVAASTLIFPLYIYPSPGAWDPLKTAIVNNPTLSFQIIVNPNNGPGYAPWWPNSDYIREIPLLNSYPNVQMIGYVHTNYTNRAIADINTDIATYAGWSTSGTTGLYVDGIFFDETVNTYSAATKQYLDSITATVKSTAGIQGARTVIHNPGTAVDPRLADPGPDITVTVETDYATYNTQYYQDWLATSPYDRTRSSYMVYGVPAANVASFAYTLRDNAAFVFVTDLTSGIYNAFGSSWNDFIAALAAA